MTASRRHSTCQASDLAGQCGFQLAQPAALAQHQLADAALLALREARRVHVRQQVGAVAVVVVVRDHQARSRAAGRPSPARAVSRRRPRAARCRTAPAPRPPRAAACAVSTPKRCCSSATEASRMSPPARLLRAACRRSCRSTITPWRSAPLAGNELGDAEVGRQRVQDGQPAGQHGAALGLQPGQLDAVDVAGGDAAFDAPAQALGRDAAVAEAGRGQHLRHRAGRARRAQRLLPAAGAQRAAAPLPARRRRPPARRGSRRR